MVTRWSALTAAVALFVGLGLVGDTPDTRDSTGQVAGYFVSHSASVLAGAVFLGVAVAALLVLAASLGDRVAQSAATVVATVMLTALVLPYVALAYVVGAEASDAAKPLFELTLAATPVIALPLALLVGSTGAAFAAHRRFAVASLLLAALMVAASASFAASGFFSPDVQQQVVFQGFLVWLVMVAFTRTRAPSALPRPRPLVDSAR